MKRAYNHNISERANRCLDRREAEVRAQKCFLAIATILIIAICAVFGGCIHVSATEGSTKELQKYYTSIRVEAGDTLWDIAGEYAEDAGMTRQEYIDEVCQLNGIEADEIYAGEYIVVMYYAVGE